MAIYNIIYFVFLSAVILTANVLRAQQPITGFAGGHCEGTANNRTCKGSNMFCKGVTCTCNDSYFAAGQNCLQRIQVDAYCNRNEFSSLQCVDHAVCDTRLQQCQCQAGFIWNGTACKSALPPHTVCTIRPELHPCVENAECKRSGAHLACLCNNGYYASASECNKRIAAGDLCDLREPSSEQCVDHALCSRPSQTCQCQLGFRKNGPNCTFALPPNSECTRDHFCVENANCTLSGGVRVCLCNKGYYVNGSHCAETLEANVACDIRIRDPNQCVANSVCNRLNRTCQCEDGYFTNLTVCSPVLKVGRTCNTSIPDQCLKPSECQLEVHNNRAECSCPGTHFNNRSQCSPTLYASSPCDTRNHDEKQCVGNATCHSTLKICLCNDAHFDYKGQCKERISAGESCDSSYSSSTHIGQCTFNAHCNNSSASSTCQCDSGFYQNNSSECSELMGVGGLCVDDVECVENAECNDDTINICTCRESYYSKDNVTCYERLAANAKCDASIKDAKQCVENATCHNIFQMCICNETHYDQEGLCLERISAGESCNLTYSNSTHIGQCTFNAHCNGSSVCQCDSGFYQSSSSDCSKLMGVDGHCSDDAECVENAECNNTNIACTCKESYYSKDNVTCNERLAANAPCYVRMTNAKQCVENAICHNIFEMCICIETHYDYEGQCLERISVGEMCNVSYTLFNSTLFRQCTFNAHCNASSVCQCDSGFYHNSSFGCVELVTVGGHCDDDVECVENAECHNTTTKHCACMKSYYSKDGITCSRSLWAGNPCNASNNDQCVDNASCDKSTNTCVCQTTFFNKAGECESRIAVNGTCSSIIHDSYQCPDNSRCISNQCLCDEDYFSDNGKCIKRVRVGDACTSSLNNTEQCVDNAVCPVSNSCECNQDYFDKGGICDLRIKAGSACDAFNNNTRQCVESSSCNKTHPSSSNYSVCHCYQDFYNNDGLCEPRKHVNETCELDFDSHQCVDNANCVSQICSCDSNYFQDGTDCSPRIKAGENCTAIINNSRQCVEFAECNGTRCECQDDFYMQSGACIKRIKAGSACDAFNTNTRQCVDNSSCNKTHLSSSNYSVCHCYQDFYNNDGICEARKNVTESCELDLDNPQCVDNAYCENQVCTCDNDYFHDETGCSPRIKAGENCTAKINNSRQCVEFAECNGTSCECQDDFYMQSGACIKRIPAGVVCNDTAKCVGNATCSGQSNFTTCQCDTGFFDKGGVCAESVQIGGTCQEFIGQCAENAACDRNTSTCLCLSGFFFNDSACHRRLQYGERCNDSNPDVLQCQDNAKCLSGVVSTCICMPGSYINSFGQCHFRLTVGDKCVLDSECPVNSHCTSPNSTCQCDDDFFLHSIFCSARVPLKGLCDHTINASSQCVDDNAECNSRTDTCECKSSYTQHASQPVCNLAATTTPITTVTTASITPTTTMTATNTTPITKMTTTSSTPTTTTTTASATVTTTAITP